MTLSAWPVARLPRWVDRVNQVLAEKELKSMKRSIARCCPFGSDEWVEKTAQRLGLESTLKAQGRPKKVFLNCHFGS